MHSRTDNLTTVYEALGATPVREALEISIRFQRLRQAGFDLRVTETPQHLQVEMRALLQQVLEGLKENLQHLLAGKSIQHLPLEMDSIDVGAPMRFNVPLPVVEEDVATDIVEAAPVIPHRHDTTAPESDTAVASASVTTPSTSDKATTGKPPSAAAEPALPVRRIGFWRAVKEWIFSPWEVTWKDVRNRPDDRDT